jgi:hypothetical protein
MNEVKRKNPSGFLASLGMTNFENSLLFQSILVFSVKTKSRLLLESGFSTSSFNTSSFNTSSFNNARLGFLTHF